MTSKLTPAPNQDDRTSGHSAVLEPIASARPTDYGEIEYAGLPVNCRMFHQINQPRPTHWSVREGIFDPETCC